MIQNWHRHKSKTQITYKWVSTTKIKKFILYGKIKKVNERSMGGDAIYKWIIINDCNKNKRLLYTKVIQKHNGTNNQMPLMFYKSAR